MDRRKVKFTHFIIVNENNKPMSFDGDQLCYNSTDRRLKFGVQIYNEDQANKAIELSIKFRNKHGFTIQGYKKMPVMPGGYIDSKLCV